VSPLLSLEDITVSFGAKSALGGIDLTIDDGEIVALLGPSGCGKSTLLRVVAGLQPIDTGVVSFRGLDQAGLAPERRDIGLMFQDDALFPHLSVFRNIEFGLRMAKVRPVERRSRVESMLALVGMEGFGARDTATLSGGEAQRVALARSLVTRPSLLLLDEPLGSLDRRLRDRLIDDIGALLDTSEVAALYVTHDHDEAFALADRIAVMGEGCILALGTPSQVWADPRTEEVARFLGHRNIVSVDSSGRFPWGDPLPSGQGAHGPSGRILLRSDRLALHLSGPRDRPHEVAECRVTRRRFRGDRFDVRVELSDGSQLDTPSATPPELGSDVWLEIPREAIVELER